ncbi:uncharacterized protein A1O5_05120 [Cladophialophora psammophila CBS 110553]|uniref:Uncharacterized protein n=1 Tax=Cladophialophora psammophila CBS 110553 TaxID=1182543 RepID=W9XLT0_9EURO|nr:uncharacterized protein A1O5_05120 [Cladophialophora psammophila CBS 110553]EXJ71314.1 hypothetical protein A1O5_05120 [Cladophialophora psammophila CBS 110553]
MMLTFLSSSLYLALLCTPNFASASPHNKVQGPTIKWHSCNEDYSFPSDFQCTELEVPVDWKYPKGPKIRLFMNKAPAINLEERIGSLVLNPGGPGGAGSTFLANFAYNNVSGSSVYLREYFDLIGPDPRGTGLSAPIKCDPGLWNQRVSKQPRTEAAFDSMVAHWRELGLDCMKRTGASFNYSDTISAAHDLEAIRLALGEGGLNYLGFSYGTQLGSQYAEIFPSNIRSMVLDGATDHSFKKTSFPAVEVKDYEIVLDHFVEWASTNENSVLKGLNVSAMVDDVFAKAEEAPIPAPGCKQDSSSSSPCRPNVSGEEMKTITQEYILQQSTWGLLAEGVKEAHQGNATLLSKPWYTASSSTDFSQSAISCQDWMWNSSWAEWTNRQDLLRSVSPRLQGVSEVTAAQAVCLGWPSPVVNPEKPLNVTGVSTNILVVNALFDPETPYEMAVNLQTEIEGSVLLTRRGDGHTSYGLHGDTQRAIDNYLVNLTLPGVGTIYDT